MQVQNQLKRTWLNFLTKKFTFVKFIYKKALKNYIIHVACIFPHILKMIG